MVALAIGLQRRFEPQSAEQWRQWLMSDQPAGQDRSKWLEDITADAATPGTNQQATVAESGTSPNASAPGLLNPIGQGASTRVPFSHSLSDDNRPLHPLRPGGDESYPAGVSPLRPDDSAHGEEGSARTSPVLAAAGVQAQSNEPHAVRPASATLPEVVPANSSAESKMETIDLMRQSCSTDPPAAARARAELEHRNFTEVHLELARRLFAPDAEVRKELARALPGLQSVDAAPWLLQLSRDTDAEVRLVAVSLLATTSDVSLLAEVEGIARQDVDPRIQAVADRIVQQRDAIVRRVEGSAR
jgi:hypothetical protein